MILLQSILFPKESNFCTSHCFLDNGETFIKFFETWLRAVSSTSICFLPVYLPFLSNRDDSLRYHIRNYCGTHHSVNHHLTALCYYIHSFFLIKQEVITFLRHLLLFAHFKFKSVFFQELTEIYFFCFLSSQNGILKTRKRSEAHSFSFEL